MVISINRPVVVPASATTMEKSRKKNFSECEVEVLISEVEARHKVLFGSLSSGISTKTKRLHWEHVTKAVNAVGAGDGLIIIFI